MDKLLENLSFLINYMTGVQVLRGVANKVGPLPKGELVNDATPVTNNNITL